MSGGLGKAVEARFASLSSGLLARKGQAKPAMRPQGFGGFGHMTMGHEDLGWNDMGYDRQAPADTPPPVSRPAPALSPADHPAADTPVVLRQREVLADSFADQDRDVAAAGAGAVAGAGEPAPILSVKPRSRRPAAPETEIVPAAPIAASAALSVAAPVAAAMTEAVAAPDATAAPIVEDIAPPSPSGRKAAFTLRLDARRHLRLRLACAVGHRSAQQLVLEALDRLLDEMPGIDELAGQVPAVRQS